MSRRATTFWSLVFTLAAVDVGAQQRWAVDTTPVVDIRGTTATGALQFGIATGATRLSSGTIAIADGSTLSVRFFSPTGQPTRSVGRAGQGPGEFRSIRWMGSCGSDSVYVWDLGSQRMSVIAGTSGEVARQFRIPAGDASGPRPFTVGCSRQRTFAYMTVPTTREATGVEHVVRGSAPLVVTDGDGRVVRQVAAVASGEMGAIGGAGFPRPLGKNTSFALVGDRVFIGTADSAAIDEYLPDGSKRTIRWTAPERPATQKHMDEAIDEITGMAPPAARERATASLRQIAMPKLLPPYSALLPDVDGAVWIVQSFPGDPTTSLRAVRPGGEVVASVELPRALTVFEIGRDYILGGYEDAAAEPHIAMYRLRRQ
jgi:hypothetical protein